MDILPGQVTQVKSKQSNSLMNHALKPRSAGYVAYVLGGLVSCGGVVGYAITGQVHSILMGFGFGALC